MIGESSAMVQPAWVFEYEHLNSKDVFFVKFISYESDIYARVLTSLEICLSTFFRGSGYSASRDILVVSCVGIVGKE